VLVFSFDTSPADNGVFSSVIGQFFDRYWLHKVAGVGESDPFGNGFGVNLVTSQTDDLGYRMTTVTQAGVVHLKALSGCIFEYTLVHPAALLGLEWPEGQPSDAATATFRAGVNTQNVARTPGFLGRPVSASAWTVEIDSGSPDGILPAMDLSQLEDIQLIFDTTYGSRTPGLPDPAACIRVDY
jgi:hypothetical protein